MLAFYVLSRRGVLRVLKGSAVLAGILVGRVPRGEGSRPAVKVLDFSGDNKDSRIGLNST